MTELPFLAGNAPDRPALLDDAGGDWLSYGGLTAEAQGWAARMPGPRGLVLLYARNDIASVAALLGALAAGHAVALLDPRLPDETRVDLETLYGPTWVIGRSAGQLDHPGGEGPLHPDLALLLSTSGSTGSPKLVRLSLAALTANALGIAEVLDIQSDDVAAGYLPLHYSYGLSVLTSHLVRGASIRLTNGGLMDAGFWPALRDAAVSHMPGVPFHYQVMLRLGLGRLGLSRLRSMTQAGGAMDTALRARVHAHMEASGGRFFVLYGQTEASPRMTTLQHDEFPDAPTSVGRPLPGCRIEILDPDGTGQGEVVFVGPNVMLGYAETRADLGRGDTLQGRLHTGDVGFLDKAGRLVLTGRVKRVAKIYGLRVNLDEVEALANETGVAAVTQTGDSLTIHLATRGDTDRDTELTRTILARLQQRFTLPLTSYRFRIVADIPKTDRGKTNYALLETPR